MLKLEKDTQQNQELSNNIKLTIKTPKDCLTVPKINPKEIKSAEQPIHPTEKQNNESLFEIY